MKNAYAARPTTVVAFYSYVDGDGRSCAVANVALILGSQGYRVLVVDLDLKAPSQHRYLSAFIPGGSTPGEPVRIACDFIDKRGSVDFLGPIAEPDEAPLELIVERAELVRRGYDFVLIDTPPRMESGAATAELADVLVLGYSLNKQFMDKTVQYVRGISGTSRGRDIRILPVPMKVDQKAAGYSARMRLEARRQFAWLLGGMDDEQRLQYWDSAEIPYEPDYASEEGLPFLDDPSAQRDRLVGAYARLAGLLAPGTNPARSAAVTDRTRARYRSSRRAGAGGTSSVIVLHAAADRYWAEWLVSVLLLMDLAAERRRIDTPASGASREGSHLLVVSGHLLGLRDRDRHLAAVTGTTADGQALLGVSVDGSRLPAAQFPTLAYVDMTDKSVQLVHQELAAFYQVPGTSPSARSRLYYPGRAQPASNLPPRAIDIHGRDDELDRIRDYFMAGTGLPRLAVTGPAGFGKTQLALEYAYRFGAHYDLVFRIRANSVEAIRAGLAELAEITRPKRPGGDAGPAALRELQAGPMARWLLIYDGADVPSALHGLLPDRGHGHVLLTARAAVGAQAEQLPLAPLAPRDAGAMLVSQVPGLLPGEAAQVAGLVGGVPLSIRLAAAWIKIVIGQVLREGARPSTVTANAAQEFSVRFADMTRDDPAGDAMHATVALVLAQLASDDRGAAAWLLVETCAFAAPSGMSRRLLRSPAMLAQLAEADSELADPVAVHDVLRTLTTHGLSVFGDAPQSPLEIHAAVLDSVRARLTPAQRTARERAVTLMLADSAPLDIDDDVIAFAEIYRELMLHVAPSGAVNQTDPAVRRWLVNQVRFLWQTESVSAWNTAVDLSERLAEHWVRTLQEKEDDQLLLRLRTQLANVYRSLGEFDRARELDRATLYRQRRVLGLRHLRTLMTARSYGADLRLVGDFEGALLEDQSTWQAFSQTLGDDHLLTIIASNNLALSELMCGGPEHALERQLEDVGRCDRIESERPWEKGWILSQVGALLRELGRYEESRKYLTDATMEFDDLVSAGTMASTALGGLRAAASRAMTERRLGKPSLSATQRALDACRDTYGEDSPYVPGLLLSRAGDLHALRRYPEAVEQAARARDRFAEIFGANHPFTRLCEVDLSIYALTADQIRVADEASEAALASLSDSLGPRHLWSLAAATARANVLAMTRRLAEAQLLEEQALAEYSHQMGPDHPFTRAVAINAAHTRMLLNDPQVIPDSEKRVTRRQTIELDAPSF